MSEFGTEFEGDQKPLPPEDVTGEQYEKALQNLDRFKSLDKEAVGGIQTLDGLNMAMHNVGRDLRAAIISSGKRYKAGPVGDYEQFAIKERMGDKLLVAAVNDEERNIDIELYENDFWDDPEVKDRLPYQVSRVSMTEYDVRIPFDEITVQNDKFKDLHSARATDSRNQQIRKDENNQIIFSDDFHPATKPHDPTELQGYVLLAKGAVGDVSQFTTKPENNLPPLE